MSLSFFHTYISPEARHLVQEVLQSGFLSEGKTVEEFEQSLCREFGFPNCIALNSGTSALHLALDLLDVKPGDEVILPAQTFVATGLAILYRGAKPVFADIRYEDGNLDPGSVRTKLSPKTKAVICVHWGGYPCDLNALRDVLEGTEVKLVEDAAHALGAVYKGRSIGGISDITCFSFQAFRGNG